MPMIKNAQTIFTQKRKALTCAQSQPQTGSSTAEQAALALCVIPAAGREEKAAVSLATTMHSLVLSDRQPIALEIAGTHTRRSFIIRARSKEALSHVASQLQARYPQAELASMEASTDPFQLQAGEEVSAIELKAGASSYLPLQNWENETARQGTDPLLGLLAALDGLPQGMRAISQLALVPVEVAWLRRQRQRVVAQAQQQEQQSRMTAHGETGPHPVMLLLGGLLLALLLLYSRYQQALPKWVQGAIHQLLQGKMPHLSGPQQFQFYGSLLSI